MLSFKRFIITHSRYNLLLELVQAKATIFFSLLNWKPEGCKLDITRHMSAAPSFVRYHLLLNSFLVMEGVINS